MTNLILRAAACFLLATACSITTTATLAAAVPSGLGLHVSGNQLLTGTGHPVVVRGVNLMDGYASTCIVGPPTRPTIFLEPTDQAGVDVMKSWGINTVRVIVNQDCWNGSNGVNPLSSRAPYWAAIINYTNLLTSNGMIVILSDLWMSGHVAPYVLQPMPDTVNAPVVWNSIAGVFKNNSSVMFELFNEPAPDGGHDTTAAWTCIRDGGTCPGVPYPASGMQSLLNVVRAAGATNVVLVGGAIGAETLDRYLEFEVKDSLKNVAPYWHAYAVSHCHDQTCWDSEIAPTAAQRPMIATEIGEFDYSAAYIDQLMPWLDSRGAGYLPWAWYAAAASNPASAQSLLTSYDGTSSTYGAGFRSHLAALGLAPTASPTPSASPTATPTAQPTPALTAVPTVVVTPTATASTYAVTWAGAGQLSATAPGQLAYLTVKLTNTGTASWLTSGSTAVRMTSWWMRSGVVVPPYGDRELLPVTVPPNGQTSLSLAVVNPSVAAAYTLHLQLVAGDTGWFGPGLDLPLSIS